MEEKFKAGLANQAFDELGNLKDLRETFIHSGASKSHINTIETMMEKMYEIYIELTRPENAE